MTADRQIGIPKSILVCDRSANNHGQANIAKTPCMRPKGGSVTTTTHQGEIRAQLLRGFEDFLALAGPWSNLESSMVQPDVFQTHEWLQCWWEAFGGDGDMVIPCLWLNGRLIGAAAMHLRRSWFRGLPIRKLSFLANSVTGSANFLIAPDYPDAIYGLMSALCAEPRFWDMMELRRICCQSRIWERLTRPQKTQPWYAVDRPDNTVPIITIDGTWEAFLSGRSKGFRKIIRRRLGKIDKSCESVRVIRLTDRDDILAALPDVFAISSRSWKAGRGRALTDNPTAMDLYRRLSDRLGSRGWVQLWLLEVGATRVAFEYHLCHAGIVCPIRADFDERFASLSPGAHLEHEILRHLFQDPARSFREYNTCADDYAYERQWTCDVRQLGTARIFPKNLYGRLLNRLGRLHRLGRSASGPITSVRQTT